MTSSKDLTPPRPDSRQAWDDGHQQQQQQRQLQQVANEGHVGLQQRDVRDVEALGGSDPEVDNIGGTTGDEKKGCWASFSGCITGIWTTRQLANSKDREIYVKTTLRELIVYVIFLIILCTLTFGMTGPNMFYFTKVMNGLFVDTPFSSDPSASFSTISSMDDVWTFLTEVAVPQLYPEQYYNNQERRDSDKNVLYECKLLGMPRLRQLRVRSDSCSVPKELERAIKACYDDYTPNDEDKEPFGIKNGTAWVYHTEEDLGGSSHWGLLATYSGAGSYEDLGTTSEEAMERIDNLKQNLWIMRGTRAVFLDFTIYNANINLFCVVKLVMEFPATGGVIPSWSFRTVKLIRYVTVLDYVILACEIIFCFFIVYYIIEEILEIMKVKCPYFKSVWNFLDIVVIAISLVCIAFSIYRTISVDRLLSELLTNFQQFPDFELLGFWQTQYNNAVALAVFFAWIKIFKYISFNKTMTQLSSTLSKCAKDVAGFGVMFFIVFFAFAQLGYLLFGSQVEGFLDFGTSVFTLLRTILGDFDFRAIEQANRVLGPIFFITYVFFVFFVLLNMFLAIINDTYSEVKAEIARQKNEFEIADYFLRGYNNVLGKMGRRDKIIDIQTAIKLADSNGNGRMSFEDIRRHLKQRNFCDTEIEMFFSKYDKDANEELSTLETKKMLADLEGEKGNLDKEIETKGRQPGLAPQSNSRPPSSISQFGTNVSYEEFTVLSRRVDRMEHSIGSIVSKIDAVLTKLEIMEKSRVKRREAMNKILDTITEKDAGRETSNSPHMENLVAEELAALDVPKSSFPR